jgi:hypothetical protein
MTNRLNPKEMAKIREKIEAFELRQKGFRNTSCATVSAKNICLNDGIVTANVSIRDGKGVPISIIEGAQYPLQSLLGVLSV